MLSRFHQDLHFGDASEQSRETRTRHLRRVRDTERASEGIRAVRYRLACFEHKGLAQSTQQPLCVIAVFHAEAGGVFRASYPNTKSFHRRFSLDYGTRRLSSESSEIIAKRVMVSEVAKGK